MTSDVIAIDTRSLWTSKFTLQWTSHPAVLLLFCFIAAAAADTENGPLFSDNLNTGMTGKKT